MTNAQIISPAEIEAASRALITARKTNLGIEVQLPVVYPTGQSVTVVVTVQDGDYVVHDAGFGAMALTSSGVALTRHLHERIQSLAKHYGCDFIEGRMSRRCNVDQIALAIVLVANASRTVGDQALEAKRRPIASFKRELTEVVSELYGNRVRQEEAIQGTGSIIYRIDAVILDKTETKRIAFVEALGDEQSVNRRFREFYDLKRLYRDVPHRIAVYDNRRSWRDGDLSILKDVGEPLPYSEARSHLTSLAA